MLPGRAEKFSQRRQMRWALLIKQLVKCPSVGKGIPTWSFTFMVQTITIAYAGGDAAHLCPLVTIFWSQQKIQLHER